MERCNGHLVIDISRPKHLSRDENQVVGGGVPVNLADVYSGVIAPGLLKPAGDVSPDRCPVLSGGGLEIVDKSDQSWVCLFDHLHPNPPHSLLLGGRLTR